jgi:hypothetical protein
VNLFLLRDLFNVGFIMLGLFWDLFNVGFIIMLNSLIMSLKKYIKKIYFETFFPHLITFNKNISYQYKTGKQNENIIIQCRHQLSSYSLMNKKFFKVISDSINFIEKKLNDTKKKYLIFYQNVDMCTPSSLNLSAIYVY